MFADLDDFKAVSDRCGHTTGDRVFIEVGDRLRSAVRDVDEVGRLGGEQLLIVCPNIGGPGPALEIGDRIADSLQAQLRFGGNEVSLRASVGVAFTTDELDPERLTARADQAIYEAKRAGNGGQ